MLKAGSLDPNGNGHQQQGGEQGLYRYGCLLPCAHRTHTDDLGPVPPSAIADAGLTDLAQKELTWAGSGLG